MFLSNTLTSLYIVFNLFKKIKQGKSSIKEVVRVGALLSMKHLALFSLPCFAIVKALSVLSKQTSPVTPRALTPSTLAKSQTFLETEMPSRMTDLGCWSTLAACVQYVYKPKMSEMVLSCYRWESEFFFFLLFLWLYSLTCMWWLTFEMRCLGVSPRASRIDYCFKVASYSLWLFGVGISDVLLSRITF